MASLLSVNPSFSGYLGLPRVVQVNLRMVLGKEQQDVQEGAGEANFLPNSGQEQGFSTSNYITASKKLVVLSAESFYYEAFCLFGVF